MREPKGPTTMQADASGGAGARRPGILDVARLAGVSRQTVSNVLNDRSEYFSDQTRARVLQAMEALAYRPNRAAQSLRSRRTGQIGYHMFGEQLETAIGFTLSFLQALIKAASRAGYHLVVFTHQDEDPRPVFQELMARRSVDGFILAESQVDDPRARLLAASGMPFASFGRLAADLPQPWVDIDNVAAMGPLVEHLVRKGHRRFAFVGAEGGEYWKRDRLAGLRLGLSRFGLALPDDTVYFGAEGGIREMVYRMLQRPEPPTAIVTSSDAVAARVVNVCQAAGRRVGADVAVTGFDGGAIGLLTEPTLTTVRIPVEKVADALIDRCRSDIAYGPTDGPGVLVPTELVHGGSA